MLSTLFFLVFSCGTFLHVHGWGAIGHNIIAHLAQSQLTGPAIDWVESLVPWHLNGNLSAMASWADSILYENSNPTGSGNWQWSRPLHFLNIPTWNCSYQVERDCINDTCIDGAIRNYTKRLESKLDDIQHREALYFLIHYVGDIHQPLHTSFQDDFGGNSVRGRFMNKSGQTNLHTLWDSEILNLRIQRDFNSNSNVYYDYIYQLMIRQSPTDNDNDILQWVKEGINFVCQQVYFDDDNNTMNASIRFNLGEDYYRRSFPIIDQRLADGGRRLGALLNRLGRNRPIASSKDKLCLSAYILIAVLCVQFILGSAFTVSHSFNGE